MTAAIKNHLAARSDTFWLNLLIWPGILSWVAVISYFCGVDFSWIGHSLPQKIAIVGMWLVLAVYMFTALSRLEIVVEKLIVRRNPAIFIPAHEARHRTEKLSKVFIAINAPIVLILFSLFISSGD